MLCQFGIGWCLPVAFGEMLDCDFFVFVEILGLVDSLPVFATRASLFESITATMALFVMLEVIKLNLVDFCCISL